MQISCAETAEGEGGTTATTLYTLLSLDTDRPHLSPIAGEEEDTGSSVEEERREERREVTCHIMFPSVCRRREGGLVVGQPAGPAVRLSAGTELSLAGAVRPRQTLYVFTPPV